MKTNPRLAEAVKSIVDRDVQEPIDLWPQIADRIQKKERAFMNPKWKFAWSVLLVVLAAVMITTIAYALVTYFRNDPGMEAVDQTGLVTNLEMTAVPAPNPTPTALPPADPVGAAQTRQGAALTLDWVYLDDAWQAIGFSAAGLADGQRLGMPRMRFGDLSPQQYRGAGMTLAPTEQGLTGRYVVTQIVRSEKTYGIADTFADVTVEIPLLDASGQEVDTFRFAAPHLLIHQGTFTGGNTYAVRAAGQEIRLEWISMSPQETRVQFCSDAELRLETASIQWARGPQKSLSPDQAPAAVGRMLAERTVKDGWKCAEVLFPGEPDPQNLSAFRLVLTTPREAGTAEWEFNWPILPQGLEIPGIAPEESAGNPAAEPTPLASQAIGGIQVTLLQAYMDTLRAAVVLRVEGTQPGVYPELLWTDTQGLPFNTGYSVELDPADPHLLTASFTFDDSYNGSFADLSSMPEGRFVGNLVVKTDPWQTYAQSFTFQLDLPVYPVVIRQAQQAVTSNGIEIRLQKIEMTPSYSQAYLCYQLPTASGDWYIDHETTSLQIGQISAAANRMEGAEAEGNSRCLTLGFPIGAHGDLEELTLTINGLRQTPPEVIPEDQVQMAREKLRQQGIEMDWVVVSGSGGGGAGPQITQKPEGMTDEEVMDRFYDALGYGFSGSWVFTLTPAP